MAAEPAPSQRPRIDWYQTDAYVSVSVFVKGVAQETAGGVVSNEGRTVTVNYEVAAAGDAGRNPCSLDLHLSHPVLAASLQLSVKPTRLDLRLDKLQPGFRWAVLEGTDTSAPTPAAAASAAAAAAAASTHSVAAAAAAAAASTHSVAAGADNPEQGRHLQAKNWDAIAKSIEDDKPEGDAALNDLFQKIYTDGTDEQRKAMVKSFTESGGTVLSTNWGDVGKGKVDVKPPDGMEYKKWDA